MFDFLADPNAWAGLITLTVLEVILGIDNLIFLTVIAARVEESRQKMVRQIGLIAALVMRIVLLFSISWVISLTEPLFEVWGETVSWRDIILGAGGLFLLFKGTREIHHTLEGEHEDAAGKPVLSVASAIVQIAILDMVFSLDSVITAVGMVDDITVMVIAVTIAIGVMMFAAEPVGAFVMRHPTVKMLALAFLLLIGVTLIAESAHFHIPKGYIYFAIFFAMMVEALNLWAANRRRKRKLAAA